MFNKIKRLFSIDIILIFGMILLIIFRMTYITAVANSDVYSYSEAGYLINKTSENCFHYIMSESNDATPEFKDYYYYTVMVDDNYIKFQLPYKEFIKYNLGDHIIVYRIYNDITKEYKNYSAVIEGIKIPAIIVNDKYENIVYY